jgi:hypothetical protein
MFELCHGATATLDTQSLCVELITHRNSKLGLFVSNVISPDVRAVHFVPVTR